MSFKMYKTECKLVRNILTYHGFHEVTPIAFYYPFSVKPMLFASLILMRRNCAYMTYLYQTPSLVLRLLIVFMSCLTLLLVG